MFALTFWINNIKKKTPVNKVIIYNEVDRKFNNSNQLGVDISD